MSASGTNLEIEVKIRWSSDAAGARERIEHAGFPVLVERTFESNTLFDRANAELTAADKLLRLRHFANRAIVTYKGPAQGGSYKTREEIEFTVSDAQRFTEVLDRLGYRPSFRYEKYRSEFATAGEPGVVTLDETPIGIFLELEGKPDWIDRTAARLGFARSEYLVSSYGALYQQYLLTHPGAPRDMTFPKPESVGP